MGTALKLVPSSWACTAIENVRMRPRRPACATVLGRRTQLQIIFHVPYRLQSNYFPEGLQFCRKWHKTQRYTGNFRECSQNGTRFSNTIPGLGRLSLAGDLLYFE